MPPKACCDDWCKEHIADIIRNQMVEQGLIEFTAEWKDGYYVFAGEVLCESLSRAKKIWRAVAEIEY